MVKIVALIASFSFIWVFLYFAFGETAGESSFLVKYLFAIHALISLITFIILLVTKYDPFRTWDFYSIH